MRDYWLTQDLLRAAGFGYLIIAVAGIALAAWWPKGWKLKSIAVIAVTALASIMPIQSAKELAEGRHKQEAMQARFAEAKALFAERCKAAGERIVRTVENVESVMLTNLRPKAKSSDRGDPNWPDAALPDEAQGDDYIRTFLFWEHHEDKRNVRGYLNNQPSGLRGYQAVDVKDSDGTVYRYRLIKSERADLSRERLTGPPARYAVSFVNLIDPADREKWIAGTKVSITDTESNEVIAERTWFSIDPGQGSTAGFRTPWGFAQSCPSLAGSGSSATRFFVDRVLKPTKGE